MNDRTKRLGCIRGGAASVKSLSAKRPYVILGCFVIGMLMTPPDVVSQSLLAVPMYLLYEVGLLFGRLVKRRSSDDEEAPDEA